MTITARPSTNRIPTFVSDERVDMKAGLLFDALSKYVTSLEGPSKAKYLAWASKHGGKVSVEYSDPGIGRFDIRVKGLKDGETMYTQAFPGDHGNLFKSSICPKYYRDCDISNCHPVLLSQLCVAEGIATPVLDRYIQQRADVIGECGLPKSQFKRLFFSTVLYDFACSERQLMHKCAEAGVSQLPELLLELREEVRTAANTLIDRYPEYMQAAIERKGATYRNLDGTALALIVQTQEKLCLHALYQFWRSKGITVGALIHDGLHVACEDSTKGHLREASEYIHGLTGYRVTLEYKAWEPPPELAKAAVCSDTVSAAEFAHSLLEGRLLNCDDRVFFCSEDKLWVSGDRVVSKQVTVAVSTMHIFKATNSGSLTTMSREANTMKQIADQVIRTAPEDSTFLARMFEQTMYLLPYTNGHYDFRRKQFVPELIECMSRVPIDFPARIQADIDEVQQRILGPIFNDDAELQYTFLTNLARALAAIVSDKVWSAGLGDRNSGKSVLCGLLELSFGRQMVRTMNSESFLKRGADADETKALGFLLPAEWARLVLTNEIQTGKDTVLNGAAIKKASSGGDSIVARGLYQNAVEFKLHSRFLICANDLPTIQPADALQTCLSFEFPTTFVDETDGRLGQPGFRAKDDSVKDLCRETRVQAAFTHIILESFGPLQLSEAMRAKQAEFAAVDDERSRLMDLFDITTEDTDYLTVSEIKNIAAREVPGVTARRYNRWLTQDGALVGQVLRNDYGKTQRVVRRVKLHVEDERPCHVEPPAKKARVDTIPTVFE
jgi:hypothetical protein